MNSIQTLAVGVRLFSIWLLWYGLTTISGTYFSAHAADHDVSVLTFSIGAIFIALICALLWLFPLLVATRLLPKHTESPTNSPLFEDWFSVGCSLLGVWSLAKSVPALCSYMIVNYLGFKIYPNSYSVNPDWPLYVAFNLLQLVFGLWLFFGARGLSKILVWARER